MPDGPAVSAKTRKRPDCGSSSLACPFMCLPVILAKVDGIIAVEMGIFKQFSIENELSSFVNGTVNLEY